LCSDHTSHEENGIVNHVEFLGVLTECGKDQWDCDIVNYYIAHILQAVMDKGARVFSSLAFD